MDNGRLMVPPTASSPTALRVVDPETMLSRMNAMYDLIAQRAFELFEQDGQQTGRDREHWFRAEQELLHPVHVNITDSDGALTVEAEVPGFNPDELQVSLEPTRLTIAGKKTTSRRSNGTKDGTVYEERCSNEILRVIDLPVGVDPAKAAATLKNGILDLRLPKAAQQQKVKVAVTAA